MARSKRVAPSMEEWRDLYAAAAEFNALGCWEWMYDSDLFGVRDPETGTIGYCCVLGNLGELSGLMVYEGAEGLASYRRVMATGESDLGVAVEQKCLALSFVSREDLDKADRAVIKALNLRFRGAMAWPQFRCHESGYVPCALDAGQARFLTAALCQTIEVAPRFNADPSLFAGLELNEFLLREQVQTSDGANWKDTVFRPEPYTFPPLEDAGCDEVRMRRLRQTAAGCQAIFEVDVFYFLNPIQEGKNDRAYIPQTLLVADRESGAILAHELAHPSDWVGPFRSAMLSLIERHAVLPAALWVKKDLVFELLKPLAEYMGIALVRKKRLEQADAAHQAMLQYFAGGNW